MYTEEKIKHVEKLLEKIGEMSLKLIQNNKGHVKLTSTEEFDACALVNQLAHEAHDALSDRE